MSTQTARNNTFPFLQLPRELRDCIYAELVGGTVREFDCWKDTNTKTKGPFPESACAQTEASLRHIPTQCMAVCRQMRLEAFEAYYVCNTFVFNLRSDLRSNPENYWPIPTESLTVTCEAAINFTWDLTRASRLFLQRLEVEVPGEAAKFPLSDFAGQLPNLRDLCLNFKHGDGYCRAERSCWPLQEPSWTTWASQLYGIPTLTRLCLTLDVTRHGPAILSSDLKIHSQDFIQKAFSFLATVRLRLLQDHEHGSRLPKICLGRKTTCCEFESRPSSRAKERWARLMLILDDRVINRCSVPRSWQAVSGVPVEWFTTAEIHVVLNGQMKAPVYVRGGCVWPFGEPPPPIQACTVIMDDMQDLETLMRSLGFN